MTQRVRHNHTSHPDADTQAHPRLVALARLLARQAARRDFAERDPHASDTGDQDTDDDQ